MKFERDVGGPNRQFLKGLFLRDVAGDEVPCAAFEEWRVPRGAVPTSAGHEAMRQILLAA